MPELAQILERFNRKERHLLVRDILGHTSKKGIQLSEHFRTRIGKTLNLTVSAEAWWATDYHLDWLAGALTLYGLGSQANLQTTYPNPKSTMTRRKLVEGSQEDADLVIADGQNLVVVEAKAYGFFNKKQAVSKFERWENLLQHYKSLKEHPYPLSIYFVLMSPKVPKHLPSLPDFWSGIQTNIPHLELELHTAFPVYEVARCDATGKSLKEGEYWRLVAKSLKGTMPKTHVN